MTKLHTPSAKVTGLSYYEQMVADKKCGLWLVLLLTVGCAGKQLATSATIYDEKADAHHDIAAAIGNAGGSNRNVVLIFGANW